MIRNGYFGGPIADPLAAIHASESRPLSKSC
jgi:hypothetical protein